jgi:hypothetical protein
MKGTNMKAVVAAATFAIALAPFGASVTAQNESATRDRFGKTGREP